MSNSITIETSLGSGVRSSENSSFTYALSSSGEHEHTTNLRDHISNDFSASKREASKAPKTRLVRRLSGFFIQDEGETARVAFVKDGQLIHYSLPQKKLHDAHITMENQPFEMDEYEAEVDGIALKGYTFRATAQKKDMKTISLDLDKKRQHKLQKILAWKSSD